MCRPFIVASFVDKQKRFNPTMRSSANSIHIATLVDSRYSPLSFKNVQLDLIVREILIFFFFSNIKESFLIDVSIFSETRKN